MRGKENLGNTEYSYDRITPAYAGKRKLADFYGVTTEDHPRLCGEKDRYLAIRLFLQGSPPPMRGKEKFGLSNYKCYRITPAYAGKRRFPSRITTIFWDHPRLCGEKAFRFKFKMPLIGSPPPMRGKVLYTIRELLSSGITPAYAGKSYLSR